MSYLSTQQQRNLDRLQLFGVVTFRSGRCRVAGFNVRTLRSLVRLGLVRVRTRADGTGTEYTLVGRVRVKTTADA